MHPHPLLLKRLITLALAATAAAGTLAAETTLSGQLAFNTDVLRFRFSLAAAADVLLWTDSWQAGLNFDPTLALFDGQQQLLAIGDDSADPAQLLPGQGGFDSQLRLGALAAGSYHLTLSASGNDALGPGLADGFSLAGSTPVAIADWNQPSYDLNANDQKGGFWRLHFSGVDQVSAVPEPQRLGLMLAGLGGLGAALARRPGGRVRRCGAAGRL